MILIYLAIGAALVWYLYYLANRAAKIDGPIIDSWPDTLKLSVTALIVAIVLGPILIFVPILNILVLLLPVAPIVGKLYPYKFL